MCGEGVRVETNDGELCVREREVARRWNELRGRELPSSLLFIPSGATARSHDLLRMIGMDRGITAPRSAA